MSSRRWALIAGLILTVALWLFLAFAHPTGTPRVGACLVLAGLAVLLRLIEVPERTPPDAPGSRVGATLIVLSWLARAAVAGFVAYTVAIRFHQPPGFDITVALAVGAGRILLAIHEGGRRLAGFPREPRAGRPIVGGVRWLVNSAVAMVLAGYAAALPALLSDPGGTVALLTASGWWPAIPGYRAVDDAAGSFVAVTLTVIGLLLAFAVVVVAIGLVQRGLAALIGSDNPLSEALRSDALIWFERDAGHARFVVRLPNMIDHFNSDFYRRTRVRVLLFNWTAESDMYLTERVSSWRMRRRYGKLPRPDFPTEDLRKRVAEELKRLAPEGWQPVRLEYRAIVGHEEIQVTVDDGEARLLPGFAAAEELRRLREERYEPGFGAPFVLTMGVWHETSAVRTPWPPFVQEGERIEEPGWTVPPSRRQYRAEMKRFPCDRKVRPFWLRNRLYRFL